MSTMTLPVTRNQAKQRARDIRQELIKAGISTSYSAALEQVAQELGYRDWNTASAQLSNRLENPFQVGADVCGHYLKRPFTGKCLAVRKMSDGTAYQVTLHFDEPVDVVEWQSFSAFRQRVTATISSSGRSWSKTSDGVPHLTVEQRII